MEKRKLTCVVCPLGCAITAEVKGDRILNISGATCKRGEAYAKTELTDPRRMLTTTMRVKGAGLVPVKSSAALPKSLLIPSMEVINAASAKAPIRPGDVLISDILGTGVDIVATDWA